MCCVCGVCVCCVLCVVLCESCVLCVLRVCVCVCCVCDEYDIFLEVGGESKRNITHSRLCSTVCGDPEALW